MPYLTLVVSCAAHVQSHQALSLPTNGPLPVESEPDCDHECCSLKSWAAASDDSPSSSIAAPGPCHSPSNSVDDSDKYVREWRRTPRGAPGSGPFEDTAAEVELEIAIWSEADTSSRTRTRVAKLLENVTTDYAKAIKKDATENRDVTMWKTVLCAAAWAGKTVAKSTSVYTPKVSPPCNW